MSKPKRVNISLPEDILRDLETLRMTGFPLNVSKVCQEALRKEIEAVGLSMGKFKELQDCLASARKEIEEKRAKQAEGS